MEVAKESLARPVTCLGGSVHCHQLGVGSGSVAFGAQGDGPQSPAAGPLETPAWGLTERASRSGA